MTLAGFVTMSAIVYGATFFAEVSGYTAGFIGTLSRRKALSLHSANTTVIVTGGNGALGQSMIR